MLNDVAVGKEEEDPDLDPPCAFSVIVRSDRPIAECVAELASSQCTEGCNHLGQSLTRLPSKELLRWQ